MSRVFITIGTSDLNVAIEKGTILGIQSGYREDIRRIQSGYREDTVRIQWCGGGDVIGICDNRILLDSIFALSDIFRHV